MRGLYRAGTGVVLGVGLIAATAVSAASQVGSIESAVDDAQVTIDLQAVDGASVRGEAVLSGRLDQTDIAIDISGAPGETVLTSYLVTGVCAEEGEVIAQLGAIEVNAEGEGHLQAELPIHLETISAAEVAVEVRAAGETDRVRLACGQHLAVRDTDVVDAAAETPSDPIGLPEPEPEPLPEPFSAPMPEPAAEPADPLAPPMQDSLE